MHVLDGRVDDGWRISLAHDHDRELARECELLLDQARRSLECLCALDELADARDAPLSAAVVSAACGLEDVGLWSRTPLPFDRVLRHFAPVPDGEAFALEPGLLRDAVLDQDHDATRRVERRVLLDGTQCLGADVLDLDGHDLGELGDVRRGTRIVERRAGEVVAERLDRRVVVGVERGDAVPEGPRRHRQHAAELAAAEDADGRTREHDVVGRHSGLLVGIGEGANAARA